MSTCCGRALPLYTLTLCDVGRGFPSCLEFGELRNTWLPHDAVEVLGHVHDGATKGLKLLAAQALTGILVDAARDEQHLLAYALGLGSQPHLSHALVLARARAADEARLLHAAQRDHGGRLHHANAGGEFALRETIFDPENAQEVPLPARDAVSGDALLQQLLEGAMGIAHQIAGAFDRRIASIAGAPAFKSRKLGHGRTVASIRSWCRRFEVPASPARTLSGTSNRKAALDSFELLVALCFRSSCQNVSRCIPNFGNGALVVDIERGSLDTNT